MSVRTNWGIVGDRHAGPGSRQILLFLEDARRAMEGVNQPGLCYARFRENFLVGGLDPSALVPGAQLKVGDAELRISEARKRCYPECTIASTECHIRDHMAFAEVVRGGTVRIGDKLEVRP